MGGRPLGAAVVDAVVDRGLVPDGLLRIAIRRLLARRRRTVLAGDLTGRSARRAALRSALEGGPITVAVQDANAQHYEVPTRFFARMLGPRLKYSSAWWPSGVEDLAAAEESMLALAGTMAELADGQDVLELGCGWGSLTLWMAEHHPRSRIVAVSNSRTQREHIEARARERGLTNVTVLTADVADLGVSVHTDVVRDGAFDRIVTVEMLEHVRGHAALGRRMAGWLRPDGRLFVHVFAHRSDPYLFETGGGGDWMARHFFTGGMMPSVDWLPEVLDGFDVEEQRVLDGTHYARTLAAWLARLDADREGALEALGSATDRRLARARLRRWRTFTIACEELFATAGGTEWVVALARFRPRPTSGPTTG